MNSQLNNLKKTRFTTQRTSWQFKIHCCSLDVARCSSIAAAIIRRSAPRHPVPGMATAGMVASYCQMLWTEDFQAAECLIPPS